MNDNTNVVVTLPGVSRVEGETLTPVPDLVEMLERLTELAKQGAIRAVAFTAVHKSLAVQRGWVRDETCAHVLAAGVTDLWFNYFLDRESEYESTGNGNAAG